MIMHMLRTLLLGISVIASTALMPTALATEALTTVAPADRVRAAFDAWRDGTGSVFDLLAEDVEWTVAGHSPVSATYRSRQDFMTRAVKPINARLTTAIAPDVKHVIAQGNDVVVIWDSVAATQDGGTYRNSYAWHLRFDGERIVHVNAFLDTWALTRLMK